MMIMLLDMSCEMGQRQECLLFLARVLARGEFFKPLICCLEGGALARMAVEAGLPLFTLKSASPRSLASRLRLWFLQRKEARMLIHGFGDEGRALAHMLRKMRRPDSAILAQSIFAEFFDIRLAAVCFALADKITCGSDYILNRAAEAGLNPSRMAVIRPGYAAEARTGAYGRSEDRFVFTAFGWLGPGQGHSVLVKAMAALWQRPDLPPWEVRIFGSGPLFHSIFDEAVSLGVSDRLALLGEQLAGGVLPLCDAILVPATDGAGNAEAIYLGWLHNLPVICAELPAHLELARHEANALVVAPDDPQVLASAMIRIIQRGDLRQDLIDGGSRMLPLLSREAMAEGFIKMYSELVAGRGWVLSPKAAAVAAPETESEDASGNETLGKDTPEVAVVPEAEADAESTGASEAASETTGENAENSEKSKLNEVQSL